MQIKKYLLIIPFLVFSFFAASTVQVHAQTCANNPAGGDTLTVNFSVPEDNTYTIWTRLIVPNTSNNSVFLQVDGGCAMIIGSDAGIPANQFTWVNYQDGNSANVISLPLTAGSHTAKFTEREGRIGIDRLLVTTNIACVPSGFGDNCPLPTNTPAVFTPTPETLPTATTAPQATSTPIPTPTATPRPTATPLPTPTTAATPVPPTPTIAANGILGTYYNNENFTGTAAMRIDPTIAFNWGTGAPISGIAADTFSVRWTGYIVPRYSQKYTFYARTDDGVRLWINNVQIINKWRNQTVTEASGTITLTAGKRYPIRMDYYESGGSAVAELRWSSSSQPKQIIQSSQLFR